ncbi:hypothetical protein [Goodfellowiella coeruleoviolacea]|uniref:Uncharacterized protein n=1 Tax=Goodfellowiella coeruleoviolacea TaxID=334858 RepID=A0AAE3GLE7_9PSEU|nr:hypothetical protein [Goodfellowiella coeruleoviolacea]MCP2169773.1 hypothetical protein [Goodfellowiella coeruleoviolacea]
MTVPIARQYVAAIDLTFRWKRGDSRMDVMQGRDMASYGNEHGNVIDQHPVDRRGWQDGLAVLAKINEWLRQKRPAFYSAHGPFN